MTQKEKPPQTQEDLNIEILVNSVMAAQHAVNTATAALRSFLKQRAGVSSGEAPPRPVPATFMAKQRKMVHPLDTPEGETNGGDGGGDQRQGREGSGSEDDA